MGKSAGSAPPAPDAAATAAAQGAANADTARLQASLNRVNQYTPTGSVTYRNVGQEEVQRRLDALYDNGNYRGSYGNDAYGKPIRETWLPDIERQRIIKDMGGNADRWEAVTTLSPNQQRLQDMQEQGQIAFGQTALAQLPRLQELMSSPFSLDWAGALNPTVTAGGAIPATTIGQYNVPDANIGYGAESRARVEKALFDRLNPSLDQQRTALDTRLRNQGLTPGSEAWNTAMREQAMADTDARLGVVAQGGQEEGLQAQIANALFGQKMQGAQFNLGRDQALFDQQMQGAQFGLQRDSVAFSQTDQARQRMIEKILAERQVPMNELAALLGGTQVSMPQFQQAAPVNVGQVDYTSAVGMNQAAQNTAYQGKVANAAANNQAAAAGVAATATIAAAVIA